MSQADLLDQDPVFQLKGSMLAITVLELARSDLQRFEQQLQAKVAQAPGFFQNTPLILALDKLPAGEGALDLTALLALCRQHGLCPLAIRAQRAEDLEAARLLGMPVLPPSGARERPLDPAPAVIATAPPEPLARPARIITQAVRGGQQIYAQGCDLVVLAAVSAGAELLADGHIHVYGPLRGRALAGIKGDRSTRIFCQLMGAEMLSIAGHYKTAEDLRREPLWGQAVQASLTGDLLNITRL